MADENTAAKLADGIASETRTAPVVEKKKRAPRRPKVAAETAATAAAAQTVVETPAKPARAKRGTKIAVVKTADAKKSVVAKSPRATAVAKKQAAPAAALDDIADLIKLEEENKSLREQLASKLRDENADLRKRLGQK